MATRAEIAKARAERTGKVKPSKRRKLEARRREEPEVLEQRIETEADRFVSGRPAGGVTATRNVKVDDGEQETYELEDSGNGRPSRKSTRKAAHRAKPDSNLRRRQTRTDHSPERRASKDAAKTTKPRGRRAPASARAS